MNKLVESLVEQLDRTSITLDDITQKLIPITTGELSDVEIGFELGKIYMWYNAAIEDLNTTIEQFKEIEK